MLAQAAARVRRERESAAVLAWQSLTTRRSASRAKTKRRTCAALLMCWTRRGADGSGRALVNAADATPVPGTGASTLTKSSRCSRSWATSASGRVVAGTSCSAARPFARPPRSHPPPQSDVEDMIWEVDDDCDKVIVWAEFQSMFARCRNDKTGTCIAGPCSLGAEPRRRLRAAPHV